MTKHKVACAPSKDSDEPGHPSSLIRVFAVCMKVPPTLCMGKQILYFLFAFQGNKTLPNWDIFKGFGWLVGCFGFSGPLRQYFSLYQAVSQREGERGEKEQRRVKMSKQPPLAPTASATGSCPTIIQIVGRPSTGSLPRTIAPPDHPHI